MAGNELHVVSADGKLLWTEDLLRLRVYGPKKDGGTWVFWGDDGGLYFQDDFIFGRLAIEKANKPRWRR
jgi:hypothetical protein